MVNFFTKPTTAKKRKRTDSAGPSKKKATVSSTKTPGKGSKRKDDDEDISSEEEDDSRARDDLDEDEENEYADETAADRRRRLALQYLENTKAELVEEGHGFDAVEIDKELLADRLRESVAEDKGRIYRRLADTLSFSIASHTFFKADTKATTGVAVCYPFIYTISKDRHLIKWKIPAPDSEEKKPKQVLHTRSNSKKGDTSYEGGHVDEIITIAASEDGKFVATGGKDNRIVVWDPRTLKPSRIFKQHRSPVMGLVFRRNTNELYSCSADRTVKLWSLNELAYIETLFGHQDEVVGITALASERCVTVGARDRTARLWKIVDETQLVFRGGGEGSKKRKAAGEIDHYMEGSIDCVAMIDEEHFVTGSDNGSISFWSINKKKPIFTVPVAHGKPDPLPPSAYSAEEKPSPIPPPIQPRQITALAALPYSDTIFSGSYDGSIRVWRVTTDKKRIELVGCLGVPAPSSAEDATEPASIPPQFESSRPEIVRGVVNGISVFETGEKSKGDLYVAVALGKELRLGRWLTVPGKNGAMLFRVGRTGKEVVEEKQFDAPSAQSSGLKVLADMEMDDDE